MIINIRADSIAFPSSLFSVQFLPSPASDLVFMEGVLPIMSYIYPPFRFVGQTRVCTPSPSPPTVQQTDGVTATQTD